MGQVLQLTFSDLYEEIVCIISLVYASSVDSRVVHRHSAKVVVCMAGDSFKLLIIPTGGGL